MAGVLGNYYFDGVSFANASMLYTDAALTTAAPNGYYGQSGIVRQLIGGPTNPTLLAALPCDTCTVPCGSGVSGSGGTGQYTVTMNLGNSIGAALVTFNPAAVPDKCTWTYDGVSASEYSSPSVGYLQGVIGTISSGGACNPQITNANGSNGLTASGASFVYDSGTNQFVNQGTPVTLGPYTNQAAGGVSLTTGQPGSTIMVVPKPNTTPENVTFVIEGPCSSTGWSISVVCPAQLIGFAASNVSLTSTAACNLPQTGSAIFNAPVNGSSGNPGLYDWVFQDSSGVTPVGAGFYSISATQFIEVDTNGVIVQIGTCP
jgi:hypothetical protein